MIPAPDPDHFLWQGLTGTLTSWSQRPLLRGFTAGGIRFVAWDGRFKASGSLGFRVYLEPPTTL